MPASLTPTQVDPRGPRFGAAVTTVVLAAVLVLGPSIGLPLLIVQTFAFGAGSLLGLRYQPYGWIFRRFVRPRLGAPAELEDERPPRFAQSVGLLFAAVALIGTFAASPVVFYVATGFALVAATLNAVFDFCLGCELYLLGRRLLGKPSLVAPGPVSGAAQ
ncbi:MAG TPA: DUF4395 domain-containing protein [Propionicimonas sp.]|nr:DUF4395 domain-containing protein [Propionicimonas sp.]